MEFLTFLVSLTGTETITIGAMCGHLKQRKQNIVNYISNKEKACIKRGLTYAKTGSNWLERTVRRTLIG
jgi:hypothetical protein